MIQISKSEKQLLEKLYPNYRYPRTMRQKSHRHHYYCVEDEPLMRAIAGTNSAAAEFVRQRETGRCRAHPDRQGVCG